MKDDESLSDKKKLDFQEERYMYREEDVKEAVKKLKEKLKTKYKVFEGHPLLEDIDKIFGKDLI